MSALQGCVFNIEEFSVYDGPGIRTTVFLKGCPLRCSWCHNPEGQSREPEIVRSPNGCRHCHACERYAEKNGDTLVYTQQSINNCPNGLLRTCGEWIESSVLCERLLKNRDLLEGGGVTFSGGEPLMQSAFLLECLERLHGRVHTAVQTGGYADEAIFERVLAAADYFLFDLKLAREEDHRHYTGVSNRLILRNFSLLTQKSTDFTVRIPLIPGVTDTPENTEELANLLNDHGVTYAELLPYNKMAGSKYAMLGRTYAPDFDERQEVRVPDRIFKERHIDFRVL